jgi:hypothetical protein
MAHWFFDTAGIGALVVLCTAGPVLIAYIAILRWIASAPREDEHEPPVR